MPRNEPLDFCRVCEKHEMESRYVDSNGLYVTDIPPQATLDNLTDYFSMYGRLEDIHFSDNGVYCLVTYMHRSSFCNALDNPQYFFGRFMSMRPRKPITPDDGDVGDGAQIDPIEVVDSISSKVDIKAQIEELMTMLEVDADWYNKCQQICSDVETTLNSMLPGYKATPFGSSVTGLALKGSDLDIYFGQDVENDHQTSSVVYSKAENAIQKNKKIFRNVKCIANARVPIIKFVHGPTGIKCDLSFKNILGVQNSKLLRFLMSLDDRIKPLLMIVKYWAKLHRLTGKRMSNYSLALLVVSFLQSLHDPILPPICKLQHRDLPALRVNGWNASFDDDVTRLKPISNNLAMEELLCRFFERVSTFGFEQVVLCPIAGEAFHKTDFRQLKLPSEMEPYKRFVRSEKGPPFKVNSSMCIQDHVEMNINVTQQLRPLSLHCLREHCGIAASICHAAPVEKVLPLLLSLNFVAPRDGRRRSSSIVYHPPRTTITFHIPYTAEASQDHTAEELEVMWRDRTYDLVVKIFTDVLRLNVVTSPTSQECTDRKPGSNRSLRCQGRQILWLCRDRLWKKWQQNTPTTKNQDIMVLQVARKDNDHITIINIEPEEEDVAVIETETEPSEKGEKRKFDPAGISYGSKEKRQRIGNCSRDCDVVDLDDEDSVVDVVDLDPEPTEVPLPSRTIEEEIKLSEEMVRKGHAKSANHSILNFECILSSTETGIRIEIADRRSQQGYFSSLCFYLDDNISAWLNPSHP